jgi:hypothetical protein
VDAPPQEVGRLLDERPQGGAAGLVPRGDDLDDGNDLAERVVDGDPVGPVDIVLGRGLPDELRPRRLGRDDGVRTDAGVVPFQVGRGMLRK